jgi:hypothetical protein
MLEDKTMKETKDKKLKSEEEIKMENKKYTFPLIYILVGLFALIVLAIMVYNFIVAR